MNRRRRIFHVITRLIVGGAQEAAVLSCAHVDRDRFESRLVIGPQAGVEGTLRPLAERLGVPVDVAPALVREVSPLNDVRAIRQLRLLMREQRPDVVHTHSSKAGLLGRWAAHREDVPAVIHTVHGWSFHDQMNPLVRATYLRLERAAARWCHRIVTVSDLDREKGLSAGIGRPEQYVTIREVNDLTPFQEHGGGRDVARRRLGIPGDAAVVGTVGRFTEQKDPRTWIRAAALIAKQRPDAYFVMIGDGSLRGDTERDAAELGVADRLVTPGLRDDLPELVPALDVFLLTSRWEGLPLVIPQAMAAGVSVVASTADGNREVIRDGKNGLLTPAQAPDASAAAVVELLSDPDLRARVIRVGHETARAFALSETIPRLEAVYGESAVVPQSP